MTLKLQIIFKKLLAHHILIVPTILDKKKKAELEFSSIKRK